MVEFNELSDGRKFTVRVTPNASQNAVASDVDGAADLRVCVTVAPENGKANAAVLKLLAKALCIPKSRLQLLRGATSRNKIFQVI